MEYLPNGISLELPEGAFPLSTDSMVLAHFARLPKRATVLDIGSGCATLGLLLCAKDSGCSVTGIELDPAAHLAALENIQRNGLSSRVSSICADAASIPEFLSPGGFSVCISNPPYFSGGPISQSHPTARREDLLPPEVLMKSASWALKYGGDFFLVQRPERMAQLIALAAKNGMEAKRICLLRHKEGHSVSLVLLQFRKGAKPGLVWEELTLYAADGQPTDTYRHIYHIEEA